MNMKMKKILLMSGGFDSLLLSYQTRFVITDYIYLQYGQKFLQQEKAVLLKWIQHTKRQFNIVKFQSSNKLMACSLAGICSSCCSCVKSI